MTTPAGAVRASRVVPIGAAVFASVLALRIWGLSTRFWLLHDQIRDWAIALGPFSQLPFVGPPTHVGGYTIGPAFYWILWAIRVTFGPWFDNLPHAGGIGQAALQSAADVLLLIAIWRRLGSMWIALATIVLLTTAGYDLCLSGLVWNPVLGSTLAKMAMAFVLLDWPRRSTVGAVTTAAVAWCAVQAYTGAIYVALSVFAAILLAPLLDRNWPRVWRSLIAVVVVVAALQVPLLLHQVATGFGEASMGAVTDSIGRVLTGQASPEWQKSLNGYVAAVHFIEVRPWDAGAALAWILLGTAIVTVIRYWRDPVLLCMTILPVVGAIVGYSLFLAGLDHYFYMSVMPATLLTVVLAVTAIPSTKARDAIAIAVLLIAVAIVPARYRLSLTMHQMPEYRLLVDGSREIVKRRIPMREILTDFELPPTAEAGFVYEVLGGRFDRESPWIARIGNSGEVAYERVDRQSP